MSSRSSITTEKQEQRMRARVPAELFPPGEFIREELEARGWTQGDLARIMDRPLRLINELIAGKKQVTPETARGLSTAFGDNDPLYWMNLDAAYRLRQLDPDEDKSVERRGKLYSLYPVRELVKRGWIEPTEDMDAFEQRICRFYRIKKLGEHPTFERAARAARHGERTALQWAWLCRARALAEGAASARLSSYSESKLKAALPKLRALLNDPEGVRKVRAILADAGVRFVIVESLPGAKIDGATFWLDDRPVIALSIRFDRIDYFWFVLRYEIEHALRGTFAIDVELMEQIRESRKPASDEYGANDAANEFLVPKAEMDKFIGKYGTAFSELKVLMLAKQIGVHPGIVVWRLPFQGEFLSRHVRQHLVKIREIVTQSTVTDGWGSA